jgi:hypothetical protein
MADQEHFGDNERSPNGGGSLASGAPGGGSSNSHDGGNNSFDKPGPTSRITVATPQRDVRPHGADPQLSSRLDPGTSGSGIYTSGPPDPDPIIKAAANIGVRAAITALLPRGLGILKGPLADKIGDFAEEHHLYDKIRSLAAPEAAQSGPLKSNRSQER